MNGSMVLSERHSMAAERGRPSDPVCRSRSANHAATLAASSATVSSYATSSRPSPASGRGSRRATGIREAAVSGSTIRFAAPSTAPGFRQLVDSA